jgi:raffinose/stachyose/melibiose transport system substrate-binding protein
MHTTERLARVLIFLTVVLPLGLFGVASTAAQDAPVTVTIGFSGLNYDADKRALIQKEFADSFNAAHPDIKLEIVYQENPDSVRTALQAGEGTDIIVSGSPASADEFAAADRLLPLDTYAAKYGWKDELIPTFYESGIFDGKLYSLPLTYESLGTVWYNKTVFDQNGWKAPTTREELEKICEAAKQQNLLCFTDGTQDAPFVKQFWVGEMFDSYAGADKVYEALTGKRQWDDPVFVQAIALMKDWMDKGWINDGPDGFFSVDFDTSWSLLADGSGVMLNQGSWGFNSASGPFGESGDEWDWFMMPPLREGVERGFDLSVGDSLSINANSKNPDAAAEVLDWFYNDKERALRITKALNFGEWFVPLKWTRDELAGTGADDRYLRYIDDFGKLSGEGKIGYTIWTYWPPKSQTYIAQELDSVLVGDTSPEEYLAGLQKTFAEEMAAGQTLPVPVTKITSPD